MSNTADATAVKTAEAQIEKTGFVTEKEIPELHDMQFARDLSHKLAQSREKAKVDGYIYTEPFDYAGGKISNIVWNFDQVLTREDAEKDLAQDLGWQIIKPTLSAADQATF